MCFMAVWGGLGYFDETRFQDLPLSLLEKGLGIIRTPNTFFLDVRKHLSCTPDKDIRVFYLG